MLSAPDHDPVLSIHYDACVISLMAASRAQRRLAPSVLFIGLILLVATHLLGAHAPGFLSPHRPLTVTAPAVEAAAPVTLGAAHGHTHGDTGEVLDHAVDRVRGEADLPARTPQPADPVVDRPVPSALPGRDGARDDARPPAHGRSMCAQHCLWRQ
ncbi:hypothetical protein GCM10023086_24330 [Streptomyces venetus]|uniref:Uncharacterized protein n=1 Tax=Streptomyces venetus TaxID=1701086 RepID=A0ABP8FKX1_9ACTN